MQTIMDSFYKAGKAWVAFLIPIVIGLVTEAVTEGTAIDPEQWVQLLGVASAQWLAVYFKTNWQHPSMPEEAEEV
jgi:hypothetical protein